MTYKIVNVTEEGRAVYGNGQRSCFDIDAEFQQWLRDNQDNLPADIQAKVEAGTLVIAEASGD